MVDMYVYHEIEAESLDTVLVDGLASGDRGDRGDDKSIVDTDKLLDRRRPQYMVDKGVSRCNNLYAFVAEDDQIIHIDDGETVSLDDFVADSSGVVLRLTVDSEKCYVSDLDLYDQIKSLVEDDKADQAEELIHKYWQSILPLTNFDVGDVYRPEVMITYDIKPEDIEVCR